MIIGHWVMFMNTRHVAVVNPWQFRTNLNAGPGWFSGTGERLSDIKYAVHDLDVRGANPRRVELGVNDTSALSDI